ncbi:MAG: cystathionine beta-lyase [Methanosphaera sp. SHI613]|nr:MAG: cystathionine beta-lyase [Methanosphaera sp. SHI613]
MYNFDEVIDRHNTNSLKWDSTDVKIPMWVADMDFKVVDEIKQSILKRANHQIYAYSIVDDEYFDAYISWWKRRHDLTLKRDCLLFSMGVMPSINSIIRCLTRESDKVLIQTPVYNVFFDVVLNNNRGLVENELVYEEDNYYIDFDELEKQLSDEDVKMMLLCNPHNPVGKIWYEDEMEIILGLCDKYDVILVSDDIHCDLVNPGKSYVPAYSIDDSYNDNIIMCMAPSKTFNIAGLQTSAIYCQNKEYYDLIESQLSCDFNAMPNVFALDSAKAAFNYGDKWLDEFKEYIYENKTIAYEFIKENNLDIDVIDCEATYLLWADCSRLPIDAYKFYEYLKNTYGLYVSPGIKFGKNGSDFIRINIACPKSTLLEGLSILKEAILSLK